MPTTDNSQATRISRLKGRVLAGFNLTNGNKQLEGPHSSTPYSVFSNMRLSREPTIKDKVEIQSRCCIPDQTPLVNPVVLLSDIADLVENTDPTSWQLNKDTLIQVGQTLTIENGYSLNIDNTYAFTNEGTIVNMGYILIDSNTITNTGTITNTLGGVIDTINTGDIENTNGGTVETIAPPQAVLVNVGQVTVYSQVESINYTTVNIIGTFTDGLAVGPSWEYLYDVTNRVYIRAGDRQNHIDLIDTYSTGLTSDVSPNFDLIIKFATSTPVYVETI